MFGKYTGIVRNHSRLLLSAGKRAHFLLDYVQFLDFRLCSIYSQTLLLELQMLETASTAAESI